MAKFKKQPQQQQLPPKEALKSAPQLPPEYYKCTVCSAPFSSLGRLLSYSQNTICGKPSCKHCESQFDSNNKLYEHLGTCSALKSKTTIKVSLTPLSTFGINSSNADIAVKKEGVDRTTTTVIVVVTKMSLPATQLATQLTTELATYLADQLVTQKATTQAANEIVVFECRYCSAGFSFNSQLYQHIRESHSKKNAPSASRAIVPLAISLTTSRAAIYRVASPRLLPSIYRAILPSPSAYKAYLTIQDLYMRYASLKSIHLAKLAPKLIRIASYLTV